ncbi:MAG: DNA-directed RNA polymerase subunit delta [Peptococcaceae bacterium]|nr:DNA-directed RNA polymerase subunit delta [Peptococcaceae bacterium]
MEKSTTRRPRETIAEIGLRLLRERRQTVHYKDFVDFILRERNEIDKATPEIIAHVLTQINLDARFIHMGKGVWGLKDWAPATLKATLHVLPGDREYQPKHEDYIFDEEDTDSPDDESELLVPVDDDEEEFDEDVDPIDEEIEEEEEEEDDDTPGANRRRRR